MLCAIVLTRLGYAHDAFYPHHSEDFEAITRRRETKGLVLIITAGFTALLVGVFVVALRSSKHAEAEHQQTAAERLERGVTAAVMSAERALAENQTVASAIRQALTAYAESVGVVWHNSGLVINGNSVRCKIASDVVVIRIAQTETGYSVEVHAENDGAHAKRQGLGVRG